ncbi:hypothetical protein, partial [Nostoc sp.]|uniref:hypothetical protein n=1 Tax=Nostoc sp. TaxID=1180 RepID=UPI002FFB3C78
ILSKGLVIIDTHNYICSVYFLTKFILKIGLIEAQEALAKLDEIANECIEAEVLRQRLKVDENTFAIYTVIKQAGDRLNINQAETINAIYGNFPDYWWDARQEIDLRTELYATIYPITSSVEQTIEVTNNLLKLERVES